VKAGTIKAGARLATVALIAALGIGCTSTPTVQPWQKGNLAKSEMSFDSDPLEQRFADHTYFSKEAASGGYSAGGGGCGCN
jgi:hypothetical protein